MAIVGFLIVAMGMPVKKVANAVVYTSYFIVWRRSCRFRVDINGHRCRRLTFFSLGFVEFFNDFCCFLAEQIIQDRFLETLTRGMKEPLCLAGVCLKEV